uniref:PCF11 cleavage and polyadenylation factor subunit n=1 Tax=Strigops habroptila TaxID=2489341 RepID=A0A672TIT2_STRHB
MSAPESSAGSSEAREDACRDYQSSLEDLTFNSKPHINMLTILAEENVPFAKDIVSLIEAQIAKGAGDSGEGPSPTALRWQLRGGFGTRPSTSKLAVGAPCK